MIQYRTFSALLLGAWLGASILADVAVTQNFQTVDRFLASPGTSRTVTEIEAAGRARERFILRRNAAEENNGIFLNWEWAEIAIGAGLFLVLLRDSKLSKAALMLSLAMLAIVIVEHFLLTPLITGLGRKVDDLPATNPLSREFWILHGFYSGFDILKLLIGASLAALLVLAPGRGAETPASEPAMPVDSGIETHSRQGQPHRG